jgi:hypothetical protein
MLLQNVRIVKIALLLTAVISLTAVGLFTALSQTEHTAYLPALYTDDTGPRIYLIPECGPGPDVQVTVVGVFWDEDEAITLFWDDVPQAELPAQTHTGDFVQMWTLPSQSNGSHQVRAVSDGVESEMDTAVAIYRIPCPPPTVTPYATTTPSATAVPGSPYILVIPECGTPTGPNNTVSFAVMGANWPTNESVTIFWQGIPQLTLPAGHDGTFIYTFSFDNMNTGSYLVSALSGGGTSTGQAIFTIPCGEPTPGSTPPTTTLRIVSTPALISTPPIVAYQPVQFQVEVENQSDHDVNTLFFVDLFLDPTIILTDSIPVEQSSGYTAVSSISAHSNRVITITAPFGFANTPSEHAVYAMADTLFQLPLTEDSIRLSPPLTYTGATPAPTPAATSTPNTDGAISGGVFRFQEGLQPQYRAWVQAIDASNGQTIATTISNAQGAYAFNNLPHNSYNVTACVNLDGQDWYGVSPSITPPNAFAHVIMFQQPCP